MAEERRRAASMRFILLTLFLDIVGIGVVIPVLPQLVDEMTEGGAADAAGIYGVLAAVYAVMQFAFAPFIGALSDRYGRRPVILLCLFAFGLDYILLTFAPSLVWLFVGRVIAGITGATITAANAYIADVSTSEDRAKNFGLVGAAFGLGFIFGPALGGVLGEVWIRLPFAVAAVVTLLNALYGFFVLPESLPEEKRKPFDLMRANPVGGLAGLTRYPLVASLAVAFVFFSLAQRGLETVWVLYTDHRYGWEELENGLTLAIVGVMAAIVQGFLVGRVTGAIGERKTAVIGLVWSVFGFALYGWAPSGGWMVGMIIVGSLGGLAFPAIQGMVAGSVPDEEQGRVQGSLTSLLSITAVIAPLVSTQLFAYFSSDEAPVYLPGAPFFAGSVFLVLGLVVVVRALAKHPEAGKVTRTV